MKSLSGPSKCSVDLIHRERFNQHDVFGSSSRQEIHRNPSNRFGTPFGTMQKCYGLLSMKLSLSIPCAPNQPHLPTFAFPFDVHDVTPNPNSIVHPDVVKGFDTSALLVITCNYFHRYRIFSPWKEGYGWSAPGCLVRTRRIILRPRPETVPYQGEHEPSLYSKIVVARSRLCRNRFERILTNTRVLG